MISAQTPIKNTEFYSTNRSNNNSVYINSTIWLNAFNVTDLGFIQFYNVTSNSTHNPIFYNVNGTYNGRADLYNFGNSAQNILAYNNTYGLCTGISTNISSNDGTINITLTPNESCIVSNDYNFTEDVARENDVLWISNSTQNSLRRIVYLASNITTINGTLIILNLGSRTCSETTSIYSISNSSTYSETLTPTMCVGNNAIGLNVNNIEKAEGSNVDSNTITINFITGSTTGGGGGEEDEEEINETDMNETETNKTGILDKITEIRPIEPEEIKEYLNKGISWIEEIFTKYWIFLIPIGFLLVLKIINIKSKN